MAESIIDTQYCLPIVLQLVFCNCTHALHVVDIVMRGGASCVMWTLSCVVMNNGACLYHVYCVMCHVSCVTCNVSQCPYDVMDNGACFYTDMKEVPHLLPAQLCPAQLSVAGGVCTR